MPIRSFFIADLLANEEITDEEDCFKDFSSGQSADSHKMPIFPEREAISHVERSEKEEASGPLDNLPAWLFCTRYSDRPTAGIFIIFFEAPNLK